jgi:hypothetical protein
MIKNRTADQTTPDNHSLRMSFHRIFLPYPNNAKQPSHSLQAKVLRKE